MNDDLIRATETPRHVQSRLFERIIDFSPVVEAHQTQIGRGQFSVDGVVARAHEVWLIRNRIGPLSVGHIVPDPRLLVFLLPVAWQGEYRFNGISATASTLYIGSGRDGYATRGEGRDYFTVGLDRETFVRSLAALEGLDPSELRLHDGALELPPSSADQLRRVLELYMADLTAAQGCSGRRRAEIAEGTYGVMLEAYMSGTRLAAPPTPRTMNNERIVRIAEERFMASVNTPLSLVDLCEATGVGRTVLYEAFNSLFGTPPLSYFRKRRYMKARTSLAVSSPEATQVKHVALSLGLTHLGRFSTEYRTMFGEAPSVTLEAPASVRP